MNHTLFTGGRWLVPLIILTVSVWCGYIWAAHDAAQQQDTTE